MKGWACEGQQPGFGAAAENIAKAAHDSAHQAAHAAATAAAAPAAAAVAAMQQPQLLRLPSTSSSVQGSRHQESLAR